MRVSSQSMFTVFAPTLLLLLVAPIAAAAPPATETVVAPSPQPPSPTTPVIDHPQVRSLDTDRIENWRFISSEIGELVLGLETDTGCDFEIQFREGEATTVLSGNGGRCDFDNFVDSATIFVDPDDLVSVWDSGAVMDYFLYLHSSSGGRTGTEPPGGVPDPRQFVEIENDKGGCALAAAASIFSAFACSGSIGLAVGTVGGGGAAVFVAVGACGLYATALAGMIYECSQWNEDIWSLTPDDLVYEIFTDESILQLLEIYGLVNVEDLIVEVEALMPSIREDYLYLAR